jgi:hypothetical protein
VSLLVLPQLARLEGATILICYFTALTGITPVLVSETSSANHRGGFLGYVFIANCELSICDIHCGGGSFLTSIIFQDLGISVAYWISFGLAFVDNGYSDVRWRFLLAFQCFPALLLAAFIKMLPDSPRFLASVGRNDEARDLLNRIRKDRASQDDIDREYLEIIVTAKGSKLSSPIEFVKILFGKGGKPGMNLGRRAWLCVWLQIMASWTGITVSYSAYNQWTIGVLMVMVGCYCLFPGPACSGGLQ